MSGIWSDVLLGARSLRRAAGASAAALVTLALGIGGVTVMFSMLKAWVLEPLPFAEPNALVDIRNRDSVTGNTGGINIADFLDYQRAAQSLDGYAAYAMDEVKVTGDERAERLRGARVTPTFFPMLGTPAALGRVFDAQAGQPGSPALVILSHGLWRDRFNADPDIVGRTIRLDTVPHTIVGVLPRGFQFTLMGRVEVWRPMAFTPEQMTSRRSRTVVGLGHLRPGRTVDQTQAELSAVAQRLATEHPDTNARRRVQAITLAAEVRRHHDMGMIPVLFAMMGCVLLIACVNVTNVMLARASTRRHEMAVRLALGASKARIVRQWLVEHLLLFVAAGALGAALSTYGTDWITNSIPFENRQFLRNDAVIPVDRSVLLFTLAMSALCALLFGWLPAWTGAKADVIVDLRDSSGRTTVSRGGMRIRRALVGGEVALALGLLIASALLVQTTRNVLHVDLGFDTQRLLTFKVALDERQYQTDASIVAFYDRLVADLATRPGVVGATAGSMVPFTSSGWFGEFFVDGQPEPAPKDTPTAAVNRTMPAYAETMRLKPVSGRWVTAADTAEAPKVAIVNETMARRYLGGREPIGQRFRLGRKSTDYWTIVGVVRDVKINESTDPPGPQVYLPFAQLPSREMVIALRAASDDAARLAGTVRAAAAAIDPAEPVSAVHTMDALIGFTTAGYRVISQFVGFFGLLTLLLAGVGVYGVLAYMFAQRTREIGIRMALGATRRDVARLVIGQLRVLVLIGLVPGLLLAWTMANAMQAFLFGVTPTDWSVYVSMSLVLMAVAVLAAFFPARRAAAIEPLAALRYE